MTPADRKAAKKNKADRLNRRYPYIARVAVLQSGPALAVESIPSLLFTINPWKQTDDPH